MEYLDYVDSFDRRVDALLAPLRDSDAANRIFYSASAIADHSVLWLIIGGVLALIPSRSRLGQRAVVALLVESGFINLIVKTVFRRERPVYQGERPLPLRQPLTSSFPSGHATAATCAAILLSEDSRLTPIFFGLAAVVAVSRIHVRIHHASDVIGGVLIGALFAAVVKRVYPLVPRGDR